MSEPQTMSWPAPAVPVGTWSGAEQQPRRAPVTDLASVLLTEYAYEQLLALIVELAVGTVPTVTAASLSLRVGPGPRMSTVAATSDAVRHIDRAQYVSGGGPCVLATETNTEVATEIPTERWPSFSAAAAEAGLRAVVSLPLAVRGEPTGALNLYSAAHGAPAGAGLEAARGVARQGAIVLANANALAEARRTAANYRAAMETRTIIGRAQGILMVRQGISADEAFDILRRASQRTNRKLRDLAAEIVAGHDRHREGGHDASEDLL